MSAETAIGLLDELCLLLMFFLGFLCSYAWDVPITIVTAESGSEAWDAAPAAWIDIGVTGK